MNDEVETLMKKLFDHNIYEQVTSISELQCFMQTHVFAVWDFMSLVKRLQSEMTTVSLPWIPPADRKAARLINDIVLCEESDLDIAGNPASHLEIYLDAMDEIGAETEQFRQFIDCIDLDKNLEKALSDVGAPMYVKKFVTSNIELACSGHIEEVASNFLYGREDSIPSMFSKLMEKWNIQESDAPRMFYYLNRHIEVDGDEHSLAAKKILENVVNGDGSARKRAINSAKNAIEARIFLWDGLKEDILQHRAAQCLAT